MRLIKAIRYRLEKRKRIRYQKAHPELGYITVNGIPYPVVMSWEMPEDPTPPGLYTLKSLYHMHSNCRCALLEYEEMLNNGTTTS
jgi:hypothetical protein